MLSYYKKKAKDTSTILIKEKLQENNFALATIHRAENTNDPERLKGICKALNEIHKIIPVVLPLSPHTCVCELSEHPTRCKDH